MENKVFIFQLIETLGDCSNNLPYSMIPNNIKRNKTATAIAGLPKNNGTSIKLIKTAPESDRTKILLIVFLEIWVKIIPYTICWT